MVDLLDVDSLDIIRNILDKVKACKILRQRGVNLGNYDFKCDNDMQYENNDSFGEDALPKLLGDYAVPSVANDEGGSYADWDPEECTVYQVTICEPIIMDYYSYCTSNGVDYASDEYMRLVRGAIANNWASDYSFHEFYVPQDANIGLTLIYTDYEFFNCLFIETYYKILDYCKEFVEGRKLECLKK